MVLSHTSNNDLNILKQVNVTYMYTKKLSLTGVKIPTPVTLETSE